MDEKIDSFSAILKSKIGSGIRIAHRYKWQLISCRCDPHRSCSISVSARARFSTAPVPVRKIKRLRLQNFLKMAAMAPAIAPP